MMILYYILLIVAALIMLTLICMAVSEIDRMKANEKIAYIQKPEVVDAPMLMPVRHLSIREYNRIRNYSRQHNSYRW